MSWLNNSLNTIKGQLTNLAQEVLADTAGPGDDEYQGSELNTKTALELLNETQLQKEQLDKVCEDKDREIVALRKQITTLKSQKISKCNDGNSNSNNNDGNGDVDVNVNVGGAAGRRSETKSLHSSEEQNVEDSWCWEPAGPTGRGAMETELVDVALGSSATDMSKLNATIAKLEQQNGELRESLEELDAQHDQAIQDMLSHKSQLQEQLMKAKELQKDRLVEHELAMARLQAQLADEQRLLQAATGAQEQLQQRVEGQAMELQRSVLELAEMQQLLEKRGMDNSELIERVRQADGERDKLQRQLDELAELAKQAKEKKTSESSNSSSLGKHSEDEFIVVRNADAAGSSASTDPDPDLDVDAVTDLDADADAIASKEKLGDQLSALESRLAELTAANLKLQDVELERQLASNVVNEQLSELEKRLRISESEKEQLQLELQRKLQQLTLQNKELKLSAEADQETHANDMEQQLGSLRTENRRLQQELDASIAQAKFRQAIAEEKQEITDLDDTENDAYKLRSVLESLLAEQTDLALERTHRLLIERWQRLDSTEQRLAELQDQQHIAEHDKKTLEADISQYILQCDELMKNNELLLNELDKFKRNKLETIEEHHEETIAQLESQLDEAQRKLHQAQLVSDNQQQLKSQLAELKRLQANTNPEQFIQLEQLSQQLNELQAAKQSQQALLNTQLEHLAHQLEYKEQQLQLLQSQQKDNEILLLQQSEQLNSTLKELQSQLAEKQWQLEEHQSQLTEKQLQLEQLKELKETPEQLKQLQLQLEQKQAQDLANTEDNEQLKTQLKQLQSQLEKLEATSKDSIQLEQVTRQLQSKEQHLEQLQTQLADLKERPEQLTQQLEQLQAQLQQKEATLTEQSTQLDKKQTQFLASIAKSEQLMMQLEQLQAQLKDASATPEEHTQMHQLKVELNSKEQQLEQLQQALDTLNAEKLELIKALQQKHAENTQYYAEIQRLQPLEQQLAELHKEREKQLDQISFLKEKSDILTSNLLTEQNNQRQLQQQQIESQEQQAIVQRDLERLRAHLLEMEELHTQESVELQRELDEARVRQASLQQEVSKSSTAYTSASIRANQQAETLQAHHGLLLQQRDELLAKLCQCEDREQKQQAALTNLQCALEQFQNDKEHDIETGMQRMRRELNVQLEKQTVLQAEIAALQQQLMDANQGLRAAARLSDQLEAGQQAIAVLRDEVDCLKDANLKLEQSLSSSESSQTDKIDKSLIKSLLIGYVVSGHTGDKQQVLRMISSVLDFNAQESDKVGLNKPQSSWLGNILGGGPQSGSSSGNENLIQAFVQFLEQESQPQTTAQSRPTLLGMAKQVEAAPAAATITSSAAAAATSSSLSATSATSTTAATSSSSDQATTQSLLMSSNEFTPTRNSSSILKDILSDS